jgi:hypothetical protein
LIRHIIRRLALIAFLSLVLGQATCSDDGWTPTVGSIRGSVVVTLPVYNALIEVYRMNEVGASLEPPRFSTYSDANGRFYIVLGQWPGFPDDPKQSYPILVTARGGETYAPGSDEVIVLDNAVHSRAVLVNEAPSDELDVVLSPLTTLTEAIGQRRRELGLEETYTEAMVRATAMMNEHFMVDLHRIAPAPTDVRINSVTEDVRYVLALAGLWAMEQSIATRSGQSLPPFALLDALIDDVGGPGAILDGEGRTEVVTVGNCSPACELGPQTLRFDLTQSLMADFIPSPANGTGLDFPEIASYLYWLAGNMEPGLFGDTPTAGFDDIEQPEPAALASPFFDESKNTVRFDASLRAVHEHTDAALVDLSALLGDGPCDRVLHKHVDTLRAPEDDNPLRWRLTARDNLTGVGVEDIRAVLRPGGTGHGYELTVTKVPAMEGEGTAPAFDIVVPGDVPELAAVEGRFEIEIEAGDRLGNLATPLVGCWQHVPLAAPVHVAPLALASGPDSLTAANLDNDDVAALLGGTLPAERGYPLARIPVTNGSGEVVYLTPQLDELTGTYDRTFVSARALVREDARVDACITGNPPTCSTALPREPRQEERVISQPLPALASSASFLALRVVDAQSSAVVTCDECRPGEARLDPGRSYEVQVVATSLDFLLPTSVDPGRVARIQVGPSDNRKRLVGAVDEVEHVYCAEPDEAAGLCRGHQIFDLYQALTEARIDIQSMRISARTAPSLTLAPRTPRPSAGTADATFSTPLSTSYEWSAAEPHIPDEGGR